MDQDSVFTLLQITLLRKYNAICLYMGAVQKLTGHIHKTCSNGVFAAISTLRESCEKHVRGHYRNISSFIGIFTKDIPYCVGWLLQSFRPRVPALFVRCIHRTTCVSVLFYVLHMFCQNLAKGLGKRWYSILYIIGSAFVSSVCREDRA